MAAHATLSASGAHRWLPCPGSRKAEQGILEAASAFAQEGSAAHHLGETCLNTGTHAADYEGWFIVLSGDDFVIGKEQPADNETYWVIDAEMIEAVQMYLDYVRNIKGADGSLIVETRVDFSKYVPGGFGTTDAIVIKPGVIHVIDLKYGKGVRVDADYNSQGMLYGLGSLEDFAFLLDGKEKVVLTIVQPRLDHISEFEISTEELVMWGETEVKPKAQLAMRDDAPRVPGEKQCRFCKAKGKCKALAAFVQDAALEGFGDAGQPEPVNPDNMTPEEMSEFLKLASIIKDTVKAVEDQAKLDMESGIKIPDWKLVHGRGSRAWNDEEAAEKALRRKVGADKAYVPRKLISPAQAEKIIGKNDHIITKYVEKKEGAPTLAPESDKRPAIEPNAEHLEDFTDVA